MSNTATETIGLCTIAKTSLIDGIKPSCKISLQKVSKTTSESFVEKINKCDFDSETKDKLSKLFSTLQQSSMPIDAYDKIAVLSGVSDPNKNFEDGYLLQINQDNRSTISKTLMLNMDLLDLRDRVTQSSEQNKKSFWFF
jgi:hypothetical protein